MNDFMMLCGRPLLALALIAIPLYILFNWDNIQEWIDKE
jgi:hypothetical protein